VAHFAEIDANNVVLRVIVIDNKDTSVGYAYNSVRDAFIPPQPYQSWTLDDDANWQPPVAMPTDGQMYTWDEATTSWLVNV